MRFRVKTKGHYHFLNLTSKIEEVVEKSNVQQGVVLIFVKHTTCSLTVIEEEKGHIEDLKEIFEKIAPENAFYNHHLKWGDHNGAAHIKGAFLKPDLMIPIENGKLELGRWQNIFLIDFDEKEREREIVVKVLEQ